MSTARFRSTIHSGHKGAALEVPFDPAIEWGDAAQPLQPGRRGHVVLATIKTFTFESAIVPRAKRFWLLIDDHVLEDARVAVGDRVQVAVRPLK